jgi:hypothetical protein
MTIKRIVEVSTLARTPRGKKFIEFKPVNGMAFFMKNVTPSNWYGQLEEIVERICDPAKSWQDNILPPTKDDFYSNLIDVEESMKQDMSLSEEEFEQVMIDSGSVGDKFAWCFDKDMELYQIDAENRLIDMEEDLNSYRERYIEDNYVTNGQKDVFREDGLYQMQPTREYIKSWQGDNETEWGVRKKKALEEYTHKVDSSYVPAQEEAIDDSDGKALEFNLRMFVDRMSDNELISTLDRMDKLRNANELSWYYYTNCALAILQRLIYRGNTKRRWHNRMDWFKDNKRTHHMKTTSYEDRFYGEMNFSMEDAIDMMARAREYASLNHMDVQEALYQIIEKEEEQTKDRWTPRLEELSYDDPQGNPLLDMEEPDPITVPEEY